MLSSRWSMSSTPSTALPASRGASVKWVMTPCLVCTSSTLAPSRVPRSAGWPPPSGKKAVWSSTTSNWPCFLAGVQASTRAVKRFK